MVENYNSLAAMTLNAVTQTNVPDPFSPAVDTVDTPRLNMPEGSECHENKFTASDLQETLHPMGITIYFLPYLSLEVFITEFAYYFHK